MAREILAHYIRTAPKEPEPSISPEGEARETKYRQQFHDLLREAAKHCALRRGAPKSLDESDFDSAYRHLLSSQHEGVWHWVKKVAAGILTFGAGAAFPFGPILLASPDTQTKVAGGALTAVSILLGVGAVILAEIPIGRRH